jgi:oligopeptide transport system substrate-binding protein
MQDTTLMQRKSEAVRLFREAGYSVDQSLELELRINTLGGNETIASAVASMWKEVLGIDTRIVSEEFGVLISNIQEKKITEIFRLSWTGNYNDPQAFLQVFESDNPNNLTGYSNPEFDQLMKVAEQNLDPVQRVEILRKAEEIALADQPLIPLYFFVSKHLVRPDIVGWEENVLDIHQSKYLSR